MHDCNSISLLLGPFEDGELEPHEMQDVARHLATCKSCEEVLSDYNSIARELREVITIPPLTGFAQGVAARLSDRRPSWRENVAAFFDSLNQRWVGAMAMVSMAGAVAVLTAIVLTPYLRHNTAGGIQNQPMAKVNTPEAPSLASSSEEFARPLALPDQPQQMTSSANMNSGDSYAVIRRLESQIPTTAVWSEPENDTTVIWLPER